MTLTAIAVAILKGASPLLLAVATWLGAKLSQLIQARVKNEHLRGVLLRLDDTISAVVREVHQVTIEALKSEAPDGKLKPEVKQMAKHAALVAIKQQLGAHAIAELGRVLRLDTEGIDRFIGTRVEAAVHDLKHARVLNGVAKDAVASFGA